MRKFLLLVFFFVGRAFAQNCEYRIEADYLLWFIRDNPVPPPLVTFASLDDPIPGALGMPHTRIVLGHKDIGMGLMNGFEVRGRSWINQQVGLEGSYFLLPNVKKNKLVKTSGQPGSPNLAVPFFDVTGVCGLNDVPGETIFVVPGPIFDTPAFSGIFTLHLSSQFQGAEINGLCSLIRQPRYSLEGIWGVRWFQLKELLRFKVDTATVPNTPFAPDIFESVDQFRTTNNYVAGQLGLRGQFNCGWWCLEGVVKGSLGSTIEKLQIHGLSKTIVGSVWFIKVSGDNTLPGGIFAEPSNIGTHHDSPFAYGVETRLNNTFEINKNWAIDVGYTFLWISKLLRPGNQIDRKINSTRTALAADSRATTGTGTGPIPFDQAPESAPAAQGPVAPNVHFKQSSFWAQGLNVGIKLNF